MKSNARSIITFYLLTAGGVLVLPALLFFIYDPMQVFHKPWGREAAFHANMRLQAVGIIRHYPYDSVILGTSMLENTSSKQAGELLGGKFINISMSGSDPYERSFPLKYVLENKPVKNVIYSLDRYTKAPKGNKTYPVSSFDYLYNENLIDDFNIYFNDKFFTCLMTWSSDAECTGTTTDLDMPTAWFGGAGNKPLFGGIENWFAHAENPNVKLTLNRIVQDAAKSPEPLVSNEEHLRRLNEIKTYLNTYLLTLVAENPQTNFHLVYPPYSRIRFAVWHQSERNNARLHADVVRYLARKTSEYPNMFVYGFEDQDFLDDIANYKDYGHYDQKINQIILKSIASGNNRLTSESVETYLERSKNKALSYDLHKLAEQIKIRIDPLEANNKRQ